MRRHQQTLLVSFSHGPRVLSLLILVLSYKAKLDNNAKLANFSKALEKSVSETIELGYMTQDLASCVYSTRTPPKDKFCGTTAFIGKVAEVLKSNLNSSKM